MSPSRSWLLAALVLLGTFLLAHASTLPAALHGERVYAYAFDLCTAHFASAAAPAGYGGLTDGCDTLYSQRMAWDAWRHAREAFANSNLLSFMFVDLWRIPLDTRALNVLDLVLFVWPARLLLPLGAGLATLHLGLVALSALSGLLFARSLGSSPLAGLAAGLVAGTAGPVIEAVTRGQYPQALLPTALLLFAGLTRLRRGERGGVGMTALGAALSALFYWQNALILGMGALFFLPGIPPKRLAIALAIATIACLPALFPVLDALHTEEKMAVVPWGTPYPSDLSDPRPLVELIDEVPWFTLLSPKTGWIPVLPLLPLAVYGAATRLHARWALLALLGFVLALGPVPVIPSGGTVIDGYSTLGRAFNPIYTFVYQWVPTASRMHHPMRWAILLSVASVAATAFGVDRLRARLPDHALIAVVAGLGWAAWVGPWPLRSSPLADLGGFESCTDLLLSAPLEGERAIDDVHRLEGLLWVPRAPADDARMGGTGGLPPNAAAAAADRTLTLERAISERKPDLLSGGCVLYEPTWADRTGPDRRARLAETFGPPVTTISPEHLFNSGQAPRQIEVFRAP